MAVEKLSLRRGEVLCLVSDGVDPGKLCCLSGTGADGPLGELALQILMQCSRAGEDDATAALIRLRPAGLPTS